MTIETRLSVAADNDPDLAKAIGLIASHWTQIENILCGVLMVLLKTDKIRAETIYYSMANHRARRELILRLGNTFLSDESTRAKIQRLLRRTAKFSQKRNNVMHQTFLRFGDSGELIRSFVKFPEETEYAWDSQLEPVTIKELKRIASDISRLAADLKRFIPELAAKVDTSHEKRLAQLQGHRHQSARRRKRLPPHARPRSPSRE